MKKLLAFSLIIFSLFISCEKEKNNLFNDYQSETLIRQIGATENDMQIFTYYNTGNIYEYLQRYIYQKYSYNSDNQLIKIEIAMTLNPLSCAIIPGTSLEDGDDPRSAKIGQFIDIEYEDNGKLKSRKSYYYNDDVPVLYTTELFDYENSKIVKRSLYNPTGKLTQYYTYVYDNNGNVTTESYYYNNDDTGPELQSNIVYEYDDKNNPLIVFAVEGIPGQGTNINNIIKRTDISFYSDEPQYYTVENNYDYNELGYPIKVNNIDYMYGKEN